MALIDSEGFGFSTSFPDFITYNVLGFAGGGGAGEFSPTINQGGMYGDPFLRFLNSSSTVLRLMPSELGTFFFGARTRLNGSGGGESYLFNDILLNNQFAVAFAPTGVITVLRGMTLSTNPSTPDYVGGTVIGASAPLATPVQGWQYIEIGAVVDASAGSVIVRVNGVVVLNLSGVNTKGSAASGTVRRYGIQGWNSDGWNTQHWYLCDATGAAPWDTFLGDVRVRNLYPTADDVVAFTPNGLSTNHANARLVPPVPFTDFNSSATVGAADTFAMDQVDASTPVIYGVHLKPLMYKNDPGARSGAAVLKSGTTTNVGPAIVLSDTAAQLLRMYEADPNTGGQWSLAAVNAIKAGYQVAG